MPKPTTYRGVVYIGPRKVWLGPREADRDDALAEAYRRRDKVYKPQAVANGRAQSVRAGVVKG